MLELTGLGSVLRGIGVLYWLAALAFLIGAVMSPRTRAGKAIAVAITLAAFAYLPGSDYVEQQKRAAFEREAWAYFKNKCATEAGEKIYKTFSGVKSVLVVKPLPPATEKDLYDQFWYGDPYSASAHSQRGRHEAALLTYPNAAISKHSSGPGFDFVDLRVASPNGGTTLLRYRFLTSKGDYEAESTASSESRFGLEWNDVSTPKDREFWVASSRLRVIDLSDSSIVAERVGFYIESGFGSRAGQRRPWEASKNVNTTCPEAHSYADRIFVLKVLKPAGGG